MRPVKNTETIKKYKGPCSGFIYTFQEHTLCRGRRDDIFCSECKGKSKVMHFIDNIPNLTEFCTRGIEGWRIQ